MRLSSYWRSVGQAHLPPWGQSGGYTSFTEITKTAQQQEQTPPQHCLMISKCHPPPMWPSAQVVSKGHRSTLPPWPCPHPPGLPHYYHSLSIQMWAVLKEGVHSQTLKTWNWKPAWPPALTEQRLHPSFCRLSLKGSHHIPIPNGFQCKTTNHCVVYPNNITTVTDPKVEC